MHRSILASSFGQGAAGGHGVMGISHLSAAIDAIPGKETSPGDRTGIERWRSLGDTMGV